ncbi:MAG: 50S ribosomal protein L4 [Parvibaculaceae bacterium]|nr:50S ribosomal protein L4 [Parvibaculaceae bacterium]
MKADVTTLEAVSAGTVDLADDVFGLEPRVDLLHRMVTYQLAKRQAGTHKTKGRSEIALTGKKFVKQKGSGGARHGDRKAPQFRGGGKAFGPVVRSHAVDLNKKIRVLALKHALSTKVKGSNLIILDEAAIPAPKTKELIARFEKLGLTSALIIGGAELDQNFALAARNIPNIDVLPAQGINVYDILRREKLVLTKAALESLEARFK